MSRLFNSNRKRMIGAVVSITALMLITLIVWLQFRIVPDAEGFLPATATSHPTAGEIMVLSPSAGDTLYAELIYIAGDIQTAPQTLRAQIRDIDESILITAPIMTQFGAWAIEIPRPAYIGEATIEILSAIDPSVIHERIPVFLGDGTTRPSGTFGSLITPTDGDQIGGDTILVSGRASGVMGNKIQLVLQSGDGTTAIHEVILNHPYRMDDIFWQTDLPLAGLSGSVTLTAYFTSPDAPDPIFSRVTLVITQVAG
ncbi:MAG: hypothetical protein MUE54_06665 [Anaerolineae bacterium]|jgi:hypothetical protein|nr:hypothetical protein [Anaerolineae bacterium]